MSVRSSLLALTLALATVGTVHAESLRPIQAKSIDLGQVSGMAYYTVEQDGFHVVTTLEEGSSGTPIRFVSVLAPGQSVVLSTPGQAGALQLTREGSELFVRRASSATN
jgi:hypothetical protein